MEIPFKYIIISMNNLNYYETHYSIWTLNKLQYNITESPAIIAIKARRHSIKWRFFVAIGSNIFNIRQSNAFVFDLS